MFNISLLHHSGEFMYSFCHLIFTGVQPSPDRSLVSRDMQPHDAAVNLEKRGILLVYNEKDEDIGLMKDLRLLLRGLICRSIHEEGVSNNYLKSFHKALRSSSCVLFACTPNFDEGEYLEYLAMAIRKSRETPVVAISSEDDIIDRSELLARKVIKYSSNSIRWKNQIINSIMPCLGEKDYNPSTSGDTADTFLSSGLNAIYGKYSSNNNQYHGIMANEIVDNKTKCKCVLKLHEWSMV